MDEGTLGDAVDLDAEWAALDRAFPDETSRIERYPFASSNIASAGWADGTLEVEFHSGDVYQVECSEAEWDGFRTADSPGRYWHQVFKPRGAVRQ